MNNDTTEGMTPFLSAPEEAELIKQSIANLDPFLKQPAADDECHVGGYRIDGESITEGSVKEFLTSVYTEGVETPSFKDTLTQLGIELNIEEALDDNSYSVTWNGIRYSIYDDARALDIKLWSTAVKNMVAMVNDQLERKGYRAFELKLSHHFETVYFAATAIAQENLEKSLEIQALIIQLKSAMAETDRILGELKQNAELVHEQYDIWIMEA